MKTITPLFFLLLLVNCAPLTGQDFVDTLVLFHKETTHFDFNKSELKPEEIPALEDFLLKTEKAEIIRLLGHADSIGTYKSNDKLAQRRIQAIADYLQTNGIVDTIIQKKAFGERQPVAENKTEEGRAKNRRVEIEAYRNLSMTQLNGQITDSEDNKGIWAKVIIRGRDYIDSLLTDSIGQFITLVPANDNVTVEAFGNGYFYESSEIKTNTPEPLNLEMDLISATPGASLDIYNLYFVGDEATLLPKSKPELSRLLLFMNLNNTLRIEIAGHINHPNEPRVSIDSWNYDLSVRRARVVYNYLVSNGISPARLEYNGYGNWEMRYPNAILEYYQALNRRVEIKVLGTDDVISKEKK